MLYFHQNRLIKSEKYITQIDFAEYLRKSDISERSKVYYGRFLQNGLHGLDEMYSILKSANHCLFVKK